MPNRFCTLTALATLVTVGCCSAAVAASCDATLTRSLQSAGSRIGSPQTPKPGQARVFTLDGAEYTAGAVRRMTAELRLAETACQRGDARAASNYLDEIRETLRPPAQ